MMTEGIITILNGVPMVRVDTMIYKISDKKKVNPLECRFVVLGYIDGEEFVVESCK